MTVLITLTTAGTDSGPFDLYSDLDGYLSAFESGVSKASLVAGYASSLVPDYTNTIRVKSNGEFCTNYVDMLVGTTTTTSSTTTTTTTTNMLPVTGLMWDTTVNNFCDSTPWAITDSNLIIRYNITNSTNCGGTCNSLQAGTATATITVGAVDVNMGLTFNGIGELQDNNFEKILFKLDGVQIADAHAAGGGLGCVMGAVEQTFIIPPPYLLFAGSTHTLFIDFTTNDESYHVGAFYEVNLTFTEV